MLELLSIEIQNFLSFGKTPTKIDFTQAKSWGIFGANGSGKSAINEAIVYCLYGTPYRNTKMDDLVNRVNGEDCLVKLEFSNNGNKYMIERGIKPKVLRVFCNGSQLSESVSKKQFQTVIDDLIGIPHSLFFQLSIVDNSFYRPFMSLTTGEKRSVIDKVFGFDRLTDMLVLNRDYKSKINTKIVESKSKVEVLKEKLALSEQYAISTIDSTIQSHELVIARLIEDRKGYQERKAKTEASISDLLAKKKATAKRNRCHSRKDQDGDWRQSFPRGAVG